jgi:hypothetical protein
VRWPVLLLAACVTPYRAGTFPLDAQHLGCLDVWLQAGQRYEAEGPVVVIHLGNKCDHSAPVDLGTVRVVGGDDEGMHVQMAPYDPEHEIGPRRIDAFTDGEEWIEYHPVGLRRTLAWVDVDVGSIEAPGPERWVRLAVPR